MALTIDPTITFNGKEAMEGILDPAFSKPGISDIMTVRNNIKARQQIAFLGRINKVTKADAGCGTGAQTQSLGMSEKFWDPVPLKIWFKLCEDEFEDTFYVWLSNNGYDRRDMTKGAMKRVLTEWILEVFQDAAIDDFMRIAFFGNTAADNVSGGGSIKNGVSITDYNMVDGFWKQVFADVTATSTPRYTVDPNAGVSYTAQDTLDADEGYQALKGVLENADYRLKDQPDLVYLVSGKLFENRIFQKESLTPGLDLMFMNQDKKKDFKKDSYSGIPIINMNNVWDQWIRTDFDNGTTYDLPHRIVLTTKRNLVAGLDDVKSVDKFEVWYNRDTEEVNFRGGYKADFKTLRPFYNSVGY